MRRQRNNAMKKFLLKLCLYLLPFLVVLGAFLALEPYDYFGLRGGDSTYLSRPLSAVREMLREKPQNIILGDSRMANLNTDYIRELTGEEYMMLGFGGAQTGELLELFWYAAEHCELEKVVFGLNLYSSCGEQSAGRIPAVIDRAEDPADFVFNANIWLEAINNGKMKLVNLAATLLGRSDMMQFHEDPTDFTLPQTVSDARGEVYRSDLEAYCEILKVQLQPTSEIEDQLLVRIGEMITYCKDNGIELIIVYPPMHQSVQQLVVDAQGLDVQMEKYKRFIAAQGVAVYDMEFDSEFTRCEDNFFDGYHLMNSRKQYFAELLFTDIEAECIRRYLPTETQ